MYWSLFFLFSVTTWLWFFYNNWSFYFDRFVLELQNYDHTLKNGHFQLSVAYLGPPRFFESKRAKNDKIWKWGTHVFWWTLPVHQNTWGFWVQQNSWAFSKGKGSIKKYEVLGSYKRLQEGKHKNGSIKAHEVSGPSNGMKFKILSQICLTR